MTDATAAAVPLTVPLGRTRPAAALMEPRAAVGTLGGAISLGVLGDLLLRQSPLGLNLLLWMAAIAAVTLRLAPLGRSRESARSWVPLALGAASLMVWRDSPTLKG